MTTPINDESCTLVIFGASGDLTKRKLIPALWSMFQSRVLPEPFAVVGVARSEMTNEQFRTRMREDPADQREAVRMRTGRRDAEQRIAGNDRRAVDRL